MISYKIGNLLNAQEKLIIHGCNNHGVMGGGVALAIKNKFPEAVKQYHMRKKLNIGEVVFEETNDGRIIANAITQDFNPDSDGALIKYDKIKDWCERINTFCNGMNISTVAMPMIGAGLAGGDWEMVCKLIEKYMIPNVIVYKLKN